MSIERRHTSYIYIFLCSTFCAALPFAAISDTPPKQVMVESRFVEVQDNFTRDLGASFPNLNSCFDSSDLQRQSIGDVPSFAESAGQSLAGGLLGSLGGGGVSFGGGGSDFDDDSSGPELSPNPLQITPSIGFPFRDGINIGLQIKPLIKSLETDEILSKPSSLIGIKLNQEAAQNKGLTFAGASLVGPDCMRYEPSGRYVYEIWEETTHSWSIEFWRWRNEALVEHWKMAGSESWSELVGKGSIPIWVGVSFEGIGLETLARGGWSLVTGWTHEENNKIMLQPRVYDFLSPKTVVKQANGNTVVLGGLQENTKQTDNGNVPMLGDIPYVGRLFKETGAEDPKDNLMVFVTPRVINPVE